ncbi:hypothetical protein KOW79_020688 [Hemibagrus wyckioides]|uniref:Uncharacterized protein n=1 Tax=Hemibagrus wyckioides TaxID=337641 RepID=A0A9D3N4Y2_9TELE|nr:hypothetical protein KOW79_020688 [Hemibagrus wyckioides]
MTNRRTGTPVQCGNRFNLQVQHHGWSRLRHTSPVHRHRQVLQLLHHHRKEELCLGHICQHRCHYPVLQTEAQEGEGCNGELMFSKGFVLFAVQDEDSVTSCLESQC